MAIRGQVDGMLGTYVIGWALAVPDQGNCTITVVDEAGETVGRGRASRHRADLASLNAGRTTLSFRIPLDLPATRQVLRVLADGEELPGSPIVTGAGQVDGEAVLERGVVSGWVTERVSGFAPPLVSVVDQAGNAVGEVLAVPDTAEPDPRHAPARYQVELADRCFGAGELKLSVLANGCKFAEFLCDLALRGNLEHVSPDHCIGWVLSPDAPQRNLRFEIHRDGVLEETATTNIMRGDVRGVFPESATPAFDVWLRGAPKPATQVTSISLRLAGSDRELFDGPFVIGGRAAAVVAAQRVAQLGHRDIPGIGVAERTVIQLAMTNYLQSARAEDGFVIAQAAVPVPAPATRPRVSVLVPVYRGVDVTRACVESVLAHRNEATDHVILVNDCSPDAEMAGLLGFFGTLRNVFVLTNETNLGFVKSVNRGLGFARGSDVLLLNSDTVMFAGGLDELCRIAAANPEVGTVTAMSNNATIFSYPHVSLRAEALDDIGWAELARTALEKNAGMVIDTPTGHGFCMLVKGEVLRRVGFLDEEYGRGYGEENDLCARAANFGYRHVVAPAVIVQHRESISFVEEKESLLAENLPRLNGRYPEYTPVIMSFEDEDGLRRGRWALDEARLAAQVEKGRRFILLVTNALDGGTAKAIGEIDEAIGHADAARLMLRCQENGMLELVSEDFPLWASFKPDEIAPLFGVLAAAAPSHMFVHQLLGFPAGFIAELGALAERVHSIFYLHDYYPLCPRVTMIDAIGRFCDVADTDTCARCVRMAGSHEFSKLTKLTPHEHRDLLSGAMKRFKHVVAPSNSAAGYLRRGFPDVAVQAVPHPELARDVSPEVRDGSYDEIVLLGAIGAHKGSAKLLELAQRAMLTHPHLRFRVIGYTDLDRQLSAIGNVTITGKYTAEQLPGLIAQARGRLAIFLPSWPETYSYTLSEVARFGFIPMVPDIGAPAERVWTSGYGVVFPFPIDPAQVLEVIDGLAAGRIAPFREGAKPAALFPSAEDLARSARLAAVDDARPDGAAADGAPGAGDVADGAPPDNAAADGAAPLPEALVAGEAPAVAAAPTAARPGAKRARGRGAPLEVAGGDP